MSGKLSIKSPEVRPQQREKDSRFNTLRDPGHGISNSGTVMLLVPGSVPSAGNLCAF